MITHRVHRLQSTSIYAYHHSSQWIQKRQLTMRVIEATEHDWSIIESSPPALGYSNTAGLSCRSNLSPVYLQTLVIRRSDSRLAEPSQYPRTAQFDLLEWSSRSRSPRRCHTSVSLMTNFDTPSAKYPTLCRLRPVEGTQRLLRLSPSTFGVIEVLLRTRQLGIFENAVKSLWRILRGGHPCGTFISQQCLVVVGEQSTRLAPLEVSNGR